MLPVRGHVVDLGTELKVIKNYEGGKLVGYCLPVRYVPFHRGFDLEDQEQNDGSS